MTTTPNMPPTMPGPLGSPPPGSRDDDHLKLLSIFYFIFAGLNALGVCFGLLYIVLGAVLAANPDAIDDPNAPEGAATLMGLGVAAIGLIVVFLAALFAFLYYYAGRCLRRHTGRIFCCVIAGITCLSLPLGTILGVFTFIVLFRPSVEQLFAEEARQPTLH